MRYIFSTKVSLVLLVVLAISMASATFIENDYGSLVARRMVYEAWWFELIMLWLAINFIAHIGKYRLLSKQKLSVGLFHIAFIIIILGAGITRYTSEEGVIHIREGQAQQVFYTAKNYLQVVAPASGEMLTVHREFAARPFKPTSFPIKLGGKEFTIEVNEYIRAAKQSFIAGSETLFELAVLNSGTRNDIVLHQADSVRISNLKLATAKDTTADIWLQKLDSGWAIHSNKELKLMEMATQQIATQAAGTTVPLKFRTLYQWNEGAFVIKDIRENTQSILVT